MAEDKIKFVVIGCGHIGKRHAFMINQHPNAVLIGMVDNNKSLKDEFENTFSTTFIGDFDEFVSQGKIADIVCICTPNGLHASQSIQCMKLGYHVVCEKPMALSVEDCESIIATSKATNKNFYCVTQNRYSQPAQLLHHLVTTNKLGKILLVQVTGFWNRDDQYYKSEWKGTKRMDGGTLFTQFSHFVDTIHWLFGSIHVSQASLNNFSHPNSIEFEDTGIFSFSLPEGGMGNFSYTTSIWGKNMESTITIIGKNGTIKVGGQYMDEVVYCHIKDYNFEGLPKSSNPVGFGNYTGSAANHFYLIDDVIHALNGEPHKLADPEVCKAVVKTISDVYQIANK